MLFVTFRKKRVNIEKISLDISNIMFKAFYSLFNKINKRFLGRAIKIFLCETEKIIAFLSTFKQLRKYV